MVSLQLRRSGLIVLITLVLASVTVSFAQPASSPLWSDVGAKTALPQGERQIIPQAYRTVALQFGQLKTLLATAPHEATTRVQDSALIVELPLPDGRLERFRVVESPIMTADTAALHPTIKTYLGQGVDSPSASVRFDYTPAGFHGMILLTDATIFIDPYVKGNTSYYMSYYTRDFVPDLVKVRERFANEHIVDHDHTAPSRVQRPVADSGDVLRTYRLAVGATGEYTRFHGGTKSGAFAAITTSVNRVNTVYEREVAVRLILINNQDIIYTDPATDDYTNDDGLAMLNENQTKLDSLVGSANYDIGHVFSTGGGGIAGLGCVCAFGFKAHGVTGLSSPVGDPFDIDYVAHEIGHQFGGNHTFNGITNACGGGNRVASAAYEPGSGSTIMAYAGICGSEDLQPNSDPYFHSKSFDEIRDFINGAGNSCAVKTNTGNIAPIVNAGLDYVIPSRTPFSLTGSANDPNGDPLTYAWEQFDLGDASSSTSIMLDSGNRPLFRSFNPVSSPTRTFPKLSALVSNSASFGEALPTTSRTMNFRLTARDNRAGGGGVNYDAMQVTSVASAGPFQITTPNGGFWLKGELDSIRWDVANTNLAPISCSNVDISLSTDGGFTYPITLATSTPNNGSYALIIPEIDTNQAYVKVQCSDNIFFDISNARIIVTNRENLSFSYLPILSR